MREHDLVLARQRVEFIFRRAELPPVSAETSSATLTSKPLRRVQSGADGGAAEGQLAQLRQGRSRSSFVFFEACAPAGDLLRELDRRRVLQMGPSGFDDALVFFFRRRNVAASLSIAGRTLSSSARTAAMCIAVGNVSFDDWDILMSSFGCSSFLPASSLPRLAMTSLAFMLDCVPEPVCQTTSGKWSFSLPDATS